MAPASTAYRPGVKCVFFVLRQPACPAYLTDVAASGHESSFCTCLFHSTAIPSRTRYILRALPQHQSFAKPNLSFQNLQFGPCNRLLQDQLHRLVMYHGGRLLKRLLWPYRWDAKHYSLPWLHKRPHLLLPNRHQLGHWACVGAERHRYAQCLCLQSTVQGLPVQSTL